MISSLASPTTTRVEDVGGKAASLFRLHAMGCAVPDFFVLTAGATAQGLAPEVRTAVLEALAALGGDSHAYAVRSSGIAEDSSGHSFAGVFDTILDVRGGEAVVAAIARCLASHHSAASAAYRDSRSITADNAMAVIVQRMVDASWAGVSFSADPASQALSHVVINAVRGVGESLVSGHVNPEEILLDRRTGAVIARRAPTGQAPFPDILLHKIFAETVRIAEACGYPQDIEWAFDGETLKVLQSRPVTTIANVWLNRPLEPWAASADADPDSAGRIWTRAYADEIWAPPVSPLFYDVQNLTGQIPMQLGMYGDRRPGPPDAFKYYRAAPYLDISLLERLYVFLPRMARLPSLLNQLPPERRAAMQRAPWKWWGLVRRTWVFEVLHGHRRGFTRNHKFLTGAWAPFLAATVPLADVAVQELDDRALDAHLGSIWALANTIGFECGITVFYYAQDLKLLLTALLARWCGEGEGLYAAVSAGLAGSHTVREADHLWQIAQHLREAGSDAVKSAVPLHWNEFKKHANSPQAQRVVSEIEMFLTSHGHRGANYKDLVYPRWGDDPELLWQQVKAFLGGDGPRPAESNARSAATRIATQKACLEGISGGLAPLKRAALRVLFRYNEIYMSLRDNHRFYYDRIWWLLRRVYAEKGRRLHASSLLKNASDVFFLVRAEIAALRDGTLAADEADARIVARRAEWEETRKLQPPKFLRRGYVPDDEMPGAGETAQRLSGLAASAGQVMGRARVIYDVSELGRVGKGDILITRQTDPSWTPVFARLCGLVLETGGVLAHGASLCREFNVPCVTAVERATERIADGDLVAVNGGLGTVDIIEKGHASVTCSRYAR
jgi:pyruvate,water dikinase